MAYPVSATFRTSLQDSHKVVTLAQVCDTSGNVLATLRPLGGQVTVDIDRSTRREAGDMQFIDPDGTLRPTEVTDLLSPLTGYELRLYRGIQFPSGTQELIPLGVFNWSASRISQTETGITVSILGLQDRSVRVSRARYWQLVAVNSGTTVEDALTAILEQAWPDIPFTGGGLPVTGQTLPACAFGAEGDSDPWEDARKLADAQGYRLFFDALGQCTMTPIMGTEDIVTVVSYGSAYDSLMITSLDKSWDTSDSYNGVIAVGQGSGLPIPYRSIAWDDDPTSVTYYLGNFGRRPRTFSDPTLITQAQADAAARAQLNKSLGVAEKLTWTQLVDPSLGVDDGVMVSDPDLAVSRLYRLDRLTIPLEASGQMSA